MRRYNTFRELMYMPRVKSFEKLTNNREWAEEIRSVADGAIVPVAIGLNPSKTIAALAERISGEIIEERR